MTTNDKHKSDSFKNALTKLLNHEGGYANDPDDKGGETYRGISRKNFPNWIGWNIIDYYKTTKHFEEHLTSDFNLQAHVEDFYKTNFWNKMHCDFIPTEIAEELFELSVNTGLKRATSILQTTLNILNRNEKAYNDILVDGRFGNITLVTLRTSLKHNSRRLIFNLINILQGSFYTELMLNNPVYEKYIGWFNRIDIIK